MRIATFAAGFAFTYLKGAALRLVGALAGARDQMVLTTVANRAFGASALANKGGILGLAKNAIPMVTTAIRTLGMALVTNPIGIIIAGIATAGLQIYRHWDGVKAFMVGTFEGLKEGLQPLISKFSAFYDTLGPVKTAIDWVGESIGMAWDWFKKLFEPVHYSSEELKAAGEAGKTFGKALADGIDFVTKPLQWLIDSIMWVSDNMGLITKQAVDFKNAVADKAGNAWQATKDFFTSPFSSDEPEGGALPATNAAGAVLPAPAMANRGGNSYTDSSQTTYQITQRPGESNDDLARRITAEQERARQVRQRSMMNDGGTPP